MYFSNCELCFVFLCFSVCFVFAVFVKIVIAIEHNDPTIAIAISIAVFFFKKSYKYTTVTTVANKTTHKDNKKKKLKINKFNRKQNEK